MLTEDQFISLLEKNTGLSFKEGDFGFILGMHYPFIKQGYTSSGNEPGFIVWNRLKDGSNRTIRLLPGDNILEIISTWLQPGIEENKKIELICNMMGATPIIIDNKLEQA